MLVLTEVINKTLSELIATLYVKILLKPLPMLHFKVAEVSNQEEVSAEWTVEWETTIVWVKIAGVQVYRFVSVKATFCHCVWQSQVTE